MKLTKNSFASIALLSILFLSGISMPVVAKGTNAPLSLISTTPQTDHSSITLFGTGTVSASGDSSSHSIALKGSTPGARGPDFSKPTQVSGNSPIPSGLKYDPPSSAPAHVSPGTGGAKGVKGLNAYDAGQSNFIPGFGPLDAEPPDQGLCVGNGYVVETINGVMKVYSNSFTPLTGDIPEVSLIGFPIDQQFGISNIGGGYITSDPRCLYDAGTGHWFMSFLYLGGPGVYSKGGPFPLGNSIFGAEFVLVSATTSPIGTWNIYMIDVTNDPRAPPGFCPCFGDQPLLGADQNTIIISTNEYSIFGTTNPLVFFGGSQVYLFDKSAMASGAAKVNYAHFNVGLGVTTPDGTCLSPGHEFDCWYSVGPAASPTSAYDTTNGGTAWAFSVLDFVGSGDNRIAVWSFTGTSSITSSPSISLNLYLGTNLDFYFNPGFLVPQKSGPIPLGDVVYSNTGKGGIGCVASCSEGGLASNGDGTWDTVVYAQGAVWGAINTIVNEGTAANPAYYMGVVYWVVNAAGGSVSLASQGYIAAAGEDLLFPSIGVGPTGNGVVVFTLTGKDWYPSTAFGMISKTSGGLVPGNQIFVPDRGKSPQDSFTEYENIQNGLYRPRWGDYTWAVWSNGKVYFSAEYIQSPNCSDSAFLNDPTCGGTRDPFANWGTSINVVAAN